MTRTIQNRVRYFLAFNGSSDFLTLPIVPAVTGFNISFWAIKRNETNNARIIDWQDSGTLKGFTIKEFNKRMTVVVQTDATTTATLNGIAKPNAKLAHYIITHDGTTVRLYENNVLIATDTSAAFNASVSALTIARNSNSSASFWNGKIAELVFHETATPWTTQQMSDLYYNGVIPSGASYYLFNGNVNDSSVNAKHGTLTGGTYIDNNHPRVNAPNRVQATRVPATR